MLFHLCDKQLCPQTNLHSFSTLILALTKMGYLTHVSEKKGKIIPCPVDNPNAWGFFFFHSACRPLVLQMGNSWI